MAEWMFSDDREVHVIVLNVQTAMFGFEADDRAVHLQMEVFS